MRGRYDKKLLGSPRKAVYIVRSPPNFDEWGERWPVAQPEEFIPTVSSPSHDRFFVAPARWRLTLGRSIIHRIKPSHHVIEAGSRSLSCASLNFKGETKPRRQHFSTRETKYKSGDCRVGTVFGRLAWRQQGSINRATLARSLFTVWVGADRSSWHNHQP